MLTYNILNDMVTIIHLDPVTMSPERFQAYNMHVAGKLGHDARAFMKKDGHGYDVIECWGSSVEAKEKLIQALREVDSK
ncbi:hypothetical protein [Pseudomonas phage PA1C]|nr:hypothetical protein [Pseudomonas phage PA1C]